MPKAADVSTYNPFGQWVLREAEEQQLSTRQLAKQGNVDSKRLYRWLTNRLLRIPPADVLQAVADGLDRPLAEIQAVAGGAVDGGKETLLYARTEWERTVLAFMQTLPDEDVASFEAWQVTIKDVVGRIVRQAEYTSGRRRNR